jgi:hypothetical protein
MRRAPLPRMLTLLYALLHLLVPPLVGVADARVQAAASEQLTLHAEAQGTTRCPGVHPIDCGLCHAVAAFAVAPRHERLLPAAGAPCVAPSETLLGHASSGRFALALPRAPPAS